MPETLKPALECSSDTDSFGSSHKANDILQHSGHLHCMEPRVLSVLEQDLEKADAASVWRPVPPEPFIQVTVSILGGRAVGYRDAETTLLDWGLSDGTPNFWGSWGKPCFGGDVSCAF